MIYINQASTVFILNSISLTLINPIQLHFLFNSTNNAKVDYFIDLTHPKSNYSEIVKCESYLTLIQANQME